MSAMPPIPPSQDASPPPLQHEAPGEPIQNYLAWAIIAAIVSFCLCCGIGGIPGIVAIVFAAQVNTKANQGDIAGAQQASANAKTWCWVATAMVILGLLLNGFSLMTGGTEQYMEMMQQIQQAQ